MSSPREGLGKLILTAKMFFIVVVSQDYVVETHNTYVIIGNGALFKCEIPSFVADFLQVHSWLDNTGQEYFAQTKSNEGTKNIQRPLCL